MTEITLGQRRKQSYKDAQGQWDELVVEAPLLMKAGDYETFNLRTPGQEADLLRGHLLSEDLIGSLDDIEKITFRSAQSSSENQVTDCIEAKLKRPLKRRINRAMEIRPSCGFCGVENFSDPSLFNPLPEPKKDWDPNLLKKLPALLNTDQGVFAATGACHAAGLFDRSGKLLALAEDVGRHNALDKVLGRALKEKIQLNECLLMLSGRSGFELVIKAIRLGIGIVASISGTTSMSLDLAKATHLTLIGFCRKNSFRVYYDPGRLFKNGRCHSERSEESSCTGG